MQHEITLRYYKWRNRSNEWFGPFGFTWSGKLYSPRDIRKSGMWEWIQEIIDEKREETENDERKRRK